MWHNPVFIVKNRPRWAEVIILYFRLDDNFIILSLGKKRNMVKVMKPLEKEFNYYISNQKELLKKYNGKYIVIRNCEVIGEYTSESDAIKEASKSYDLGTFLVQKCEPGDSGYTQTFHSRVAFA